MTPAKPSLALLRSLSDEHVLRTLLEHDQLTRAELATRTGLSKPTISDSVRRLHEAGLVRDTGARTTGRGRVGTYYALADDLGVALVVAIAPAGISAQTIAVTGAVCSHAVERVDRPASSSAVAAAVARVAARATRESSEHGHGPTRLAVVSAADPVDRHTGRLVHLPDAPFLIGELSPADVLAPHVAGPVVVDNDVHWAARAEARAAAPELLTDFAYLHLGEGLGTAVVSDGQVLRGHGGIAGEIAHLITRGPDGRAMTLMEAFAALGVHRAGSTAIDAPALLARVHEATPDGAALLAGVVEAVGGAVRALLALTDPEVVVLGGEWGVDAAVADAVAAHFAAAPRGVPVRASALGPEPWIAGARQDATDRLHHVILHLTGE